MSNQKSIIDKKVALRIRALRNAAQLTQAAFAERVGIKQSTYNEIENEKREPSEQMIYSLCYRFPINEDWLRTGKGNMFKEGEPKAEEAKADMVAEHDGSTWIIETKRYVSVPRYEVAASAGGGALIHSEQIVDHLAFEAEWVKVVLGLSPNRLAVISVIGDSMEPYLAEGDLIMVDLGVTHIENNAVYVLQFGDSLLVKRVQVKLDGEVIVKSDNPLYETESFRGNAAQRLRVVGRMVRRLVR